MLLDGLSKFPVLIETHSMKARQSALEERLQETDDAIALFSRSRILVKIDEYVPPSGM
jgi:hypothetical protein